MFEIDDGIVVDPWKVAVIKRTDKGKCALFLDGQSPIDGGFVIEKDYMEAATDVLEAREEYSEQPSSDDEE